MDTKMITGELIEGYLKIGKQRRKKEA